MPPPGVFPTIAFNTYRAAIGDTLQITGQNSAEEYSWGGSFNTTSKKKTATITVKLDYETN